MPLTRISLKKGKSGDYRHAVMDQVYQAMRETFDVPEDDRFMTVSEHDDETYDFGRSYLDIARSDDLVLIQLTVSNTRNLEQKKALFAKIAERLSVTPGIRPEDIFINLVEVPKENWSFGHGLAQYA
ncbi:tautomerase family protein [Pelagibius sp. Alg239-R121]|uniref:tautomerase family protein n=1 Tax=Pelagibius sp. Alg239-R121 TaxID=2993448 RepID=UPI0024A79212|nr:tautomerase family protein [Pelagibius sp. Alg239-R121]